MICCCVYHRTACDALVSQRMYHMILVRRLGSSEIGSVLAVLRDDFVPVTPVA